MELAGYVLDEYVGRGLTGEVWRCHSTAGDGPFAIKLFRPELIAEPAGARRFLEARALLAEVSEHPNLVKIRDLVEKHDQLAMVMDFAGEGDLAQLLVRRGTISPYQALFISAEVFSGVSALHRAGIFHGDLKPENVVLSSAGEGQVTAKVTDFGAASLIASSSDAVDTFVGTPDYAAPELIVGRSKATSAGDVYSVGIMLYELLTGVTPFAGDKDPNATLRRHIEDMPQRPNHIDDQLWVLLSQLLSKQPSERPTAAVAARMSEHLSAVLVNRPALPAPFKTSARAANTIIAERKVFLAPAEFNPSAPPAKKWTLIAVILAAVFLVGGGTAVAVRSHSALSGSTTSTAPSESVSPTSSPTTPQSPETPTPSVAASDTSGSPVLTPTPAIPTPIETSVETPPSPRTTLAEDTAREINELLLESSEMRSRIDVAVAEFKLCHNLASNAEVIGQIADGRRHLIAEMARVDTSMDPIARAVPPLVDAWTAGAKSDDEYVIWAHDTIDSDSCYINYKPQDPDIHRTIGLKYSRATRASKKAFVKKWNPIARRYGLRHNWTDRDI